MLTRKKLSPVMRELNEKLEFGMERELKRLL